MIDHLILSELIEQLDPEETEDTKQDIVSPQIYSLKKKHHQERIRELRRELSECRLSATPNECRKKITDQIREVEERIRRDRQKYLNR